MKFEVGDLLIWMSASYQEVGLIVEKQKNMNKVRWITSNKTFHLHYTDQKLKEYRKQKRVIVKKVKKDVKGV